MNATEKSKQEVKSLDAEAVCLLEDFQVDYQSVTRGYIQETVTRLIAVLSILAQENCQQASPLLDVLNDVNTTTNVFLEYPEFVSLAKSLIYAYTTQQDEANVKTRLKELLIAIAPLSHLPLHHVDIRVTAGQLVHFPLLEKSILLRRNMPFSTLFELAVSIHARDLLYTADYLLIPHRRSLTGPRRFLSTVQPSKSGNEYSIFEQGQLPDREGVERVDSALEIIGRLDIKLRASMLMLFKLIAVCPGTSGMRQAGSVSSLPGWIWQDINSQAHYEDERTHLVVQLVHEFFHTKLNILEKSIPLWKTNGRTPLLYSPWKQCDRPIRQVIHALMTFSAGGVALKHFLEFPEMATPRTVLWARNYWRENLGFARSTEKMLLDSGALSEQGERLVKSIVANLSAKVESAII